MSPKWPEKVDYFLMYKECCENIAVQYTRKTVVLTYLWWLECKTLFILVAVLWHRWLGGRKGIQPVKNWGVLEWLSVWGEVHICTWPYWCHSHSLCFSRKSRLDWFYLSGTREPYNGCRSISSSSSSCSAALLLWYWWSEISMKWNLAWPVWAYILCNPRGYVNK